MDAIVNLVLATSISAAIIYSGLPPAIDETEPTSIRETMAVSAICVKIRCHGDFPASFTRRYAESNYDAQNENAQI